MTNFIMVNLKSSARGVDLWNINRLALIGKIVMSSDLFAFRVKSFEYNGCCINASNSHLPWPKVSSDTICSSSTRSSFPVVLSIRTPLTVYSLIFILSVNLSALLPLCLHQLHDPQCQLQLLWYEHPGYRRSGFIRML